jgi:hypothetical protein
MGDFAANVVSRMFEPIGGPLVLAPHPGDPRPRWRARRLEPEEVGPEALFDVCR